MKLKESMKGREGINNQHMWDLIHQCMDDIEDKAGYDIDRSNLMWLFGEATRTNGTTSWPAYDGGEFTIVLNKHLVEEDDEGIKEVICHELCHYIVMMEMFDYSIVKWNYDGDKLYYTDNYTSEYSPHGKRWQEVADGVSKSLNLTHPIKRTNSFQSTKNYRATKLKYEVKCPDCGHTWKYQKASEFVKNPNRPSNNPKFKYHYYCPYCKQEGRFITNYTK